MTIEKSNFADKFALFNDHWNPRVAAEVNEFAVKIAKLKGEFIWHHHENEDELFLVHKGRLVIELRDGEIVLNTGEFVVIPKGVEHRPVAAEEVELIMFERKETLNTGNVQNERTVKDLGTV